MQQDDKTRKRIEDMTDRVVAALETEGEWSKHWTNRGGNSIFPYNLTTKETYKGFNTLNLMMAEQEHGYNSSAWFTFNQKRTYGQTHRYDMRLAKGMKAEYIFRPIRSLPSGYQKIGASEYLNPQTGEVFGEGIKLTHYTTAAVFNLCQLEEIPTDLQPIPEVEVEASIKLTRAQDFTANIPAVVHHDTDQPAYYPTTDIIRMPAPEQFKDEHRYWATRLHETAHWTGHPDRCARRPKGGERRDKDEYAFEELVAELTATFVSASLGIKPHIEHDQYLKHYVKQLKAKRSTIMQVASKAHQAFEYLENLQPQARKEAA
jgi:antirestriction protein ArdC